jgi:insulysin
MFQMSSDKKGFEKAVDIFADMFISPNFDPKYVKQEVTMIDSEFSKNATSDAWRLFDHMQFVSDPTHRFGRFRIGNHETLDGPHSNDELVAKLSEFRKQH